MLTPNGYTEKVKYSLLLRFYAKEAQFKLYNYLSGDNEVKTDILLAFELQFAKLSMPVNYLLLTINKVEERLTSRLTNSLPGFSSLMNSRSITF